MAGTIEVAAGRRWSAASWLFDWTLTTVSRETDDPGLRARLDEIVAENLGLLSLPDLPEQERREIQRVLRERLLDAAREDLPGDLADRDDVLSLLDQLRQSASEGAR